MRRDDWTEVQEPKKFEYLLAEKLKGRHQGVSVVDWLDLGEGSQETELIKSQHGYKGTKHREDT
jgi:hypothetical protein